MSNPFVQPRTLSDVHALIGHRIGPSPTVDVTGEKIASFAEVTGDPQLIHLSDDAAQDAGFPARIAHGYFVLSLIAHWGPQLIVWPGPVINYGIDRLRFTQPVLVGDTLRATVTITDVREKGSMPIVQATYTVSNALSEDTVMVADTLIGTTGWGSP